MNNTVSVGSRHVGKVLSNKQQKKMVSEYFHQLLTDAKRNIDKGKYKEKFDPCVVLEDVANRKFDSSDEDFFRSQGASAIFFLALHLNGDKKLLLDLFQLLFVHLNLDGKDQSNFIFPYIKMNAEFLDVQQDQLKDKLVQMLSDNDEFEMAGWINSQNLND